MRRVPLESLYEHSGDLDGKVVLITGAGSGFGRAAAQEAIKNGAHVVALDVNEKGLAALQTGLKNVLIERVDVTLREDLIQAFEASVKRFKRPPDVVIANAGVAAEDHFEQDEEKPARGKIPPHPREPIDKTLKVNFVGAIQTAEVARDFWERYPAPNRGKRRLVLMSSMGGLSGIPLATLYSTSKHAIMGYWKATCAELSHAGNQADFECWTVNPFFAKTPILRARTVAALAGIPLAPISSVVGGMVYASSCPQGSLPSGSAVLVMDDGPLTIASPSEYEALSAEWGGAIAEFAQSSRSWADYPWRWQTLSDIVEVLGLRPPRLIAYTCLSILGVVIAHVLLRALPAGQTMLLGAVLAIVHRLYKTRKRYRG